MFGIAKGEIDGGFNFLKDIERIFCRLGCAIGGHVTRYHYKVWGEFVGLINGPQQGLVSWRIGAI